MSSGGKASFIGIEGSSANFAVQYNPREFSVSKSVTWEEAETQGDSTQPIQYQKGAPMSATIATAATSVRTLPLPGNFAMKTAPSPAKVSGASDTRPE